MKPGFSLLEVVFGLMISSILLTATFTIYNQINKSAQIIQNITTSDTRIMVLKDRLQKDFSGLCPLWFTQDEYEKYKSLEKTPNTQTERKQFDENIKQNSFLYSDNHDDNSLNFFTFVTLNAMQMYATDSQRMVRVVYLLKKESDNPKSFRLMRAEVKNVAPDFNQNSILGSKNFYEIVSNIASCSIEYGFIDQPKNKKGKAKSSSSEKPAELKWLQEWGVTKEKGNASGYKPTLPEFIKLQITFLEDVNTQKKHEIYFTIPINVTTRPSSFAKKRHKVKQEKAKQAKQNAHQTTGGAKSDKPGGK